MVESLRFGLVPENIITGISELSSYHKIEVEYKAIVILLLEYRIAENTKFL